MVQADISQLSAECNTWRETLRNYRQEFTDLKKHLQQIASHPLSKDDLTDLEHYQNQFHIQLINIHDLKHDIKSHERRVSFETSSHDGQLEERTVADHEVLYEQYIRLENTLQGLREDFTSFTERTR